MTDIKVKLLTNMAKFPSKGHSTDSAYDLSANENTIVPPHESVTIRTGVALGLPAGVCALILSRSGLAAKNGVFVLNAPGLIDTGYRGEIQVVLYNLGSTPYVVEYGDRIAQMMFHRVEPTNLIETFSVLSDTDRGRSGLGSTGVSYLHDDDGLPDPLA